MRRQSLIPILAFTLFAAAAAHSENPPPADEPILEFEGLIEVSEVLLDVVATDLHGQFVAGLGKDDFIVEEDGLPNARNIPVSTLHTNIWYHLALAYYLRNDLANAERGWRQCLDASDNDDMVVAATHWLYMSLRRAGRADDAARVPSGRAAAGAGGPSCRHERHRGGPVTPASRRRGGSDTPACPVAHGGRARHAVPLRTM